MNRFVNQVFVNTYDLANVRYHFFSSVFTTAGMTALLAYINPLAAALTLYDWYLLLGFSNVMRRTVRTMALHPNKYHVILS